MSLERENNAGNKASLTDLRLACVITRSDTIGGAHVHVADLAVALRERGVMVRIFVGGEGPFTDLLRRNGVEYAPLRHLRRNIGPISDLLALWELRSAIKDFSPDLIACHSAKAGLLARLAGRSLGVPAVFTAHGWSFTEGISNYRRRVCLVLERCSARLADVIITVSDYDRRLALQHGVGDPARLERVHNGVPDLEMELRAKPAANPPLLISVARLDAPKDHAGLLRALTGLKHLPWELCLVGDGPYESGVSRLIKELGMTDRVHMLGLRDDVPELLGRAQAFVLISRWEGLPLSILEAMRAGLPVVASAVGGIPELVIEGESGYLIPRDDMDIAADRLERLLSDPTLRKRMGSHGRDHYEKHFRFERMVDKTADIYLKTLGRKASSVK